MARSGHLDVTRARKKEEFSCRMDNMPLENSFPQICVVSVNKFVEKRGSGQEYGRSVYRSNHVCLFRSNIHWTRGLFTGLLASTGSHRAAERAHGKFDTIVDSGFSHQTAHVGFYGTFLDA